MVCVVVEHDRGVVASASGEALTFARSLAGSDSTATPEVTAVVLGGVGVASTMVDDLANFGATEIVELTIDAVDDYCPEAYGFALAQFIASETPNVIIACGTDRGNEVLAQAGARADLPFVANVVEAHSAEANSADSTDEQTWLTTRVRWGGSLYEQASVTASTKLISVAHHAVEPAATPASTAPAVRSIAVEVPAYLARTRIIDRVERAAGVTLATAPVVIGGGRGVGSAEAFAPLEALANELGGVVGCSRAVTNNGWRNHSDQVGQTGTRIAPTIYVASGISGAIQHWVGAMASKNILAINTDPDANMVAKADYAVIGDLHEVIPAITAEIQRRRSEMGM